MGTRRIFDDTELQLIQTRLGHHFIDVKLLETALIHASLANETPGLQENYERLEFLGDAVLGLLCAHYLYVAYPFAKVGELTTKRAHLVREDTIARFALDLDLDKHLKVGAGHRYGGIGNSILADAFESVVGAVYLDGGMDAVRACFNKYLETAVVMTEPISAGDYAPIHSGNYKAQLQEYLQKLGFGLPEYKVDRQTGPSHMPFFECSVSLPGVFHGVGSGRSKKVAEQRCAKDALLNLGLSAF